jgi:outer membrane protein TolC
LQILADAKTAFVDYWAKSEKLNILKDLQGVISRHTDLARAGARSDSSMKIHLLRAESDLELLENQIESHRQDLLEAQLVIANFLGKAEPDHFEDPAEPSLSELKITSNEPHQLKAANASLEEYRLRNLEANQAWIPDLSFRYKQMGASSMTTGYSEVMIGVTVPFVFPWDPYRVGNVASSERDQANYRFQKMKIEVQNAKTALQSRAQSYRKQLENLKANILPRAKKRMELIHGIAPRDMESLQDHREILESYSDM